MGFINSAVVLVSMMDRPEMDFPGLFPASVVAKAQKKSHPIYVINCIGGQ
jgi:hypothetical protein